MTAHYYIGICANCYIIAFSFHLFDCVVGYVKILISFLDGEYIVCVIWSLPDFFDGWNVYMIIFWVAVVDVVIVVIPKPQTPFLSLSKKDQVPSGHMVYGIHLD